MDHLSGRCGVATGKAPSTEGAMAMLRAGGNAFDAAVTGMLFLSAIPDSGYCFGGEVPIIIRPAGEVEPLVICGQGPAPRRATLEHFVRGGGIPLTTLPAAAVPGALDALLLMLERWGTQTFAACAAPVIEYLDAGEKEWQPRLADTLRRLAEAEKTGGIAGVRAAFYGGEIGAELVTWCQENGGLLERDDLAAFRATIEKPVHRSYRGHEVYKCGAWTQGPSLLETLAILQGFDLHQMGSMSSDYAHHLLEAMKLGFADRDLYYGDPDFVDVPLAALLSDEYATRRRALIDPQRASLEQRPGRPEELGLPAAAPCGEGVANPDAQDTTTCLTADEAGNIVIATPSGWGLKIDPGPTGIILGTRLQSFNIWAGHPNVIVPGKRPRITLTPTLVLKDQTPILGIAVAGGDLQDQTILSILLAHLEFGLSPQAALDHPRVATYHLVNSFGQGALTPGKASVEKPLGEEVAAELERRGHLVTVVEGRLGDPSVLGFAGDQVLPAAPKPERAAAE